MRLLLLLALFPSLAAADPTYHRVTGVAADDTLNVRAAPSASSADIGDLAHDQTGIEVSALDASGKWAQIVWQEGNGWIATRFLATDAVASVGGTGVPDGLFCGGTEPFWGLDLTQTTARFYNLGGDTEMAVTGAAVAEGRMSSPAVIGFSDGDVIVSGGSCSDGMSDRTYPWRAELLLTQGGTRRFLSGCCHLPLE